MYYKICVINIRVLVNINTGVPFLAFIQACMWNYSSKLRVY